MFAWGDELVEVKDKRMVEQTNKWSNRSVTISNNLASSPSWWLVERSHLPASEVVRADLFVNDLSRFARISGLSP